MTTVVIALLSFAVAFVAGGLLSKVYFSLRSETPAPGNALASDAAKLSLDDSQRQRYRKRIKALQGIIRRHEIAQDEIREKLRMLKKATAAKAHYTARLRHDIDEYSERHDELRDQIRIRDAEINTLRERIEPLRQQIDNEKRRADDARSELSLLKIERDELNARIHRLADCDDDTSATEMANDQGVTVTNLKADLGELRETLTQRDRQIHEFGTKLETGANRIQELERQLDAWKHRVSPLTQKLAQQHDLIQRIRRQNARIEKTDDPETAPADNLKCIRGIGPALERRLNRHGIHRFEQIAGLSPDELAGIAEKLAIAPNLVQRDRWIKQARELAGDQVAANESS